jgi:hypothetical protein
MLDLRRIDVRQMVLAFFRQVFRASYPVTRLACAGRFVVTQMPVQCLDKLDAFTQRCAQNFSRHVIETFEVLHAGFPAAILTRAVITPFAGGFKYVFAMVVVVFDELLEQQAGIHEGFY